MRVGIWWIRRDLRLHDNPALAAATAEGGVIPVFILDPQLLTNEAQRTPRWAFFREGLSALDDGLRSRGGRVVIRSGRPAEVLEQLLRESGASAVIATEDISPYARRRDAEVAARLNLRLVGGPSALAPDLATRPDGSPYLVFGPFRRAWLQRVSPGTLTITPIPKSLATPPGVAGEPLPPGPSLPQEFPAGEAAARRRLRAFLRGDSAPVYRYDTARNRLDSTGTSRLSPYLRAGVLSAREVIAAALRAVAEAPSAAAKTSARRWLDELIWREFYAALLFHRPALRAAALKPRFRRFPWVNSDEDFAAWRHGRTGYPVVDAAMRQLQATGWIPNRARMIVASFLVKHLLVDWRWGAGHFMRSLVDGDPAANSGGWQWVAGSGTDAAPYFRIFNPSLQGRTWDPQGTYVRNWVPELACVPAQYIHTPWEMPRAAQHASGCLIGDDYPGPAVDHAAARARALAIYRGLE